MRSAECGVRSAECGVRSVENAEYFVGGIGIMLCEFRLLRSPDIF